MMKQKTEYRFFEQKDGLPVQYIKFVTDREAVQYARDSGFAKMERQDCVHFDITKMPTVIRHLY